MVVAWLISVETEADAKYFISSDLSKSLFDKNISYVEPVILLIDFLCSAAYQTSSLVCDLIGKGSVDADTVNVVLP